MAPRSIVCTLRRARRSRSGHGGRSCSSAGLPPRSHSRIAAAAPIRSTPCSRAAVSTRNHSAAFGVHGRSPSGRDIERLAAHDEDAGRTFCAILTAAAKRADVNPFRPAMDGMGPRIARLPEYLRRLEDRMDLRLGRMRLGIHIDARRADAWNDQIAPLKECVASERRQGRRASIPTEMVELVAFGRHRHSMHDLAICRRAGLHVDHSERIGLRESRGSAVRRTRIPPAAPPSQASAMREKTDQASSSWSFLPDCVEAELDCDF